MHVHALSIEPLPRQHQPMLQTQPSGTRRGCSIAASQAPADVNRQLATASRPPFAGGAVGNTLGVV